MKDYNAHTAGDTRRLPPWMRRKVRETEDVVALKKILRNKNLHTVCQSAGCPNLSECFKKPTATFMILGDICTRNCRFCGVPKGKPTPPDPDEPNQIAASVKMLGLRHAVITSVTRDDLADGGAGQFADVVTSIRKVCPETTTETLIPDFKGDSDPLEIVLRSGVDILNHNVETVPGLYEKVRPEADYRQSLEVLRQAKLIRPGITTKSGIMVGLGEKPADVESLFHDLYEVGCDALTIGQYLAPSRGHFPVFEYVTPKQFEEYREKAEQTGIKWVNSGPYVRSSYNAEELMESVKESRNE